MERMPLDAPTLFDFLCRRAEQVREQRRRRGTTAAAEGGSPARGEAPYPLLSAQDRLFFRVLSRRPPAEFAAVEDTFRVAFLGVWQRIPEPDRQRLLSYWRGQPPTAGTDPRLARYSRPAIRVVEGDLSSPVCGRLGHELTFSIALATESPAGLPHAVARALAQVCLFVSRGYWALVEERFEQPLDRWERLHGKKATDASRLAKEAAVEKEFLKAYEAEVAGVLSGWGFGPDVTPERSRAAGRGIAKE
jgi:hypothetical protein